MDTVSAYFVTGLIFVLLLVFLVIYLKKHRNQSIDYYTLFMIGIVWTAIGVPLKNYALSVMGIMFFILGLVNKDKWQTNRRGWSHLSQQEKRLKIILLIVLGLLVLGGLILFIKYK